MTDLTNLNLRELLERENELTDRQRRILDELARLREELARRRTPGGTNGRSWAS